MVKIRAEFPYDEYYLYKVFHHNEQRYYAVLVSIYNSNIRTTISYARYLMSVKEKRILSSNEEVDHIDDNKLNDDINNLQILSPEENRLKESKQYIRHKVILKCPNCEKIFIKSRNQTHLIKGGKYTACSRECAGKFQHFANSDINKYNKGIKENILKEVIFKSDLLSG